MRHLLPHSTIGLLLLLSACSDRQPTPPERRTSRQPALPAGPLSDVVPNADAPTPPALIGIVGNALGCFGVGCTPAENATITVNGAVLSYASGLGSDFGGNAMNGVLAVNAVDGGGITGNGFGVIGAFLPPGTQPTAVSVPFTLRLTFQGPSSNPTPADPVTVNGIVRGVITGSFIGGGVVVAIDDKRAAGGETVKIDFRIPSMSTAVHMDLTVFSVPIQSGLISHLTGFFQVR